VKWTSWLFLGGVAVVGVTLVILIKIGVLRGSEAERTRLASHYNTTIGGVHVDGRTLVFKDCDLFYLDELCGYTPKRDELWAAGFNAIGCETLLSGVEEHAVDEQDACKAYGDSQRRVDSYPRRGSVR
jgi:hypothetical protein